jgi:hypothetical protein
MREGDFAPLSLEKKAILCSWRNDGPICGDVLLVIKKTPNIGRKKGVEIVARIRGKTSRGEFRDLLLLDSGYRNVKRSTTPVKYDHVLASHSLEFGARLTLADVSNQGSERFVEKRRDVKASVTSCTSQFAASMAIEVKRDRDNT